MLLAPAHEARARIVGGAGEVLVGSEIARLGLPELRNVILRGRGWLVEIDHLVRAPDAIVVLETKTWSGFITGGADARCWQQHRLTGRRPIPFLNPAIQNAAHVGAVEGFLDDVSVSVRGHVVSAGTARFAPSLAHLVVPLGDLPSVLLRSSGDPGDQARLDVAWRRLAAEALRGGTRHAAHRRHVNRRRRSGAFKAGGPWAG